MQTQLNQGFFRELDQIEQITPRLAILLRELRNDIITSPSKKSIVLNSQKYIMQLLQKLPEFFCQKIYDQYRRSPYYKATKAFAENNNSATNTPNSLNEEKNTGGWTTSAFLLTSSKMPDGQTPTNFDKESYQKSVDQIVQILIKLWSFAPEASQNAVVVIYRFMQHFEEHPLCLSSYLMLYKLYFYSKQFRQQFKKIEGINFIVEKLKNFILSNNFLSKNSDNLIDLVRNNMNGLNKRERQQQQKSAHQKIEAKGGNIQSLRSMEALNSNDYLFSMRRKKNKYKRRLSDPTILACVNQTSQIDIEQHPDQKSEKKIQDSDSPQKVGNQEQQGRQTTLGNENTELNRDQFQQQQVNPLTHYQTLPLTSAIGGGNPFPGANLSLKSMLQPLVSGSRLTRRQLAKDLTNRNKFVPRAGLPINQTIQGSAILNHQMISSSNKGQYPPASTAQSGGPASIRLLPTSTPLQSAGFGSRQQHHQISTTTDLKFDQSKVLNPPVDGNQFIEEQQHLSQENQHQTKQNQLLEESKNKNDGKRAPPLKGRPCVVPKLNISQAINESSQAGMFSRSSRRIQGGTMIPGGIIAATLASQQAAAHSVSSRTHKSGMNNEALYRERSSITPSYTFFHQYQYQQQPHHNRQGSDITGGCLTSNLATGVGAAGMDTSLYPQQQQQVEIFQTPSQQLQHLAMQMGESCLTNDLAALMSQRREYQLEKAAKKNAMVNSNIAQQLKGDGMSNQGLLLLSQNNQQNISMTTSPKGNNKDVLVNQTKSMRGKLNRSFSMSNFQNISANMYVNPNNETEAIIFNIDENLSLKQKEAKINNVSKKKSKKNKKSPYPDYQKAKNANTQTTRIRVILLNLLYQVAKDLTLQELQFSCNPINLLYSHLSSSQLARARYLSQVRGIQTAGDISSDSDQADAGGVQIYSDGTIYREGAQELQFKAVRQQIQRILPFESLSPQDQNQPTQNNIQQQRMMIARQKQLQQLQRTYSSIDIGDDHGVNINTSGIGYDMMMMLMLQRQSQMLNQGDTNSRFTLSINGPYQSTTQFLSTLNDVTQRFPGGVASQSLRNTSTHQQQHHQIPQSQLIIQHQHQHGERTAEFGDNSAPIVATSPAIQQYSSTWKDNPNVEQTPQNLAAAIMSVESKQLLMYDNSSNAKGGLHQNTHQKRNNITPFISGIQNNNNNNNNNTKLGLSGMINDYRVSNNNTFYFPNNYHNRQSKSIYKVKFKPEQKVILSILKRMSNVCQNTHKQYVESNLINLSKENINFNSISPSGQFDSTLRRNVKVLLQPPQTPLLKEQYYSQGYQDEQQIWRGNNHILMMMGTYKQGFNFKPITYRSIIQHKQTLAKISQSGKFQEQQQEKLASPSANKIKNISSHHQQQNSMTSLTPHQIFNPGAGGNDLVCISSIQDARKGYSLWANGIAFSNFGELPRDRVRKQSDKFLFKIDQRMRQILAKMSPQSIDFAREMQNQLGMLSIYLKKAKSRVLLFCVTDTVLQALLMLKKIILQIAAKTQHSFQQQHSIGLMNQRFSRIYDNINMSNLGGNNYSQSFDYYKYPSASTLSRQREKGARIDNDPYQMNQQQQSKQQQQYMQQQYSAHYQSNYSNNINNLIIKYKYSLEMRLMIANYLKVISIILRGCSNVPQLSKLYNELYLGDQNWNQMTRNYITGIFTVDVNIFIPQTHLWQNCYIESEFDQRIVGAGGVGGGQEMISIDQKMNPMFVSGEDMYHKTQAPVYLYDRVEQEKNMQYMRKQQEYQPPFYIQSMNLLNFNESHHLSSFSVNGMSDQFNYMEQSQAIVKMNEENREKCAYFANKRHFIIQKLIICAKTALKYYDSVACFSKRIIYQLTDSSSKARKQNKKRGDANNQKSEQSSPSRKKQRHSFNLNDEQILNWKASLRKTLSSFGFLLSPTKGLLAKYLKLNSTNFELERNDTQAFQFTTDPNSFQDYHQLQKQEKKSKKKKSWNNFPKAPINFILTKNVLRLLQKLFDIGGRFNKYITTQQIALYYIRTHYISFIRLYNKNFKNQNQYEFDSIQGMLLKNQLAKNMMKTNQEQNNADAMKCLDQMRQSQALREIEKQQEDKCKKDAEDRKEYEKMIFQQEAKFAQVISRKSKTHMALLQLCKLHLKCLLSIAKNRNQNVRKKFYQFKVLEFLVSQTDLEYDLSTRREKFLKVQKEEFQKISSSQQQVHQNKFDRSEVSMTTPQNQKKNFKIKDKMKFNLKLPEKGISLQDQQLIKPFSNEALFEQIKQEKTQENLTIAPQPKRQSNMFIAQQLTYTSEQDQQRFDIDSTSSPYIAKNQQVLPHEQYQTPTTINFRMKRSKIQDPSATIAGKQKSMPMIPPQLINSPANTLANFTPSTNQKGPYGKNYMIQATDSQDKIADLRRKNKMQRFDNLVGKKDQQVNLKPQLSEPFNKNILSSLKKNAVLQDKLIHQKGIKKQIKRSLTPTKSEYSARQRQAAAFQENQWNEYQQQTEQYIQQQQDDYNEQYKNQYLNRDISQAQLKANKQTSQLTLKGQESLSLLKNLRPHAPSPAGSEELSLRQIIQIKAAASPTDQEYPVKNVKMQLQKKSQLLAKVESLHDLKVEEEEEEENSKIQRFKDDEKQLRKKKQNKKRQKLLLKNLKEVEGDRKFNFKLNLSGNQQASSHRDIPKTPESELAYSPKDQKDTSSPFIQHMPKPSQDADQPEKLFLFDDSQDDSVYVQPPPPKKKPNLPGLKLGNLGMNLGGVGGGGGEEKKNVETIKPPPLKIQKIEKVPKIQNFPNKKDETSPIQKPIVKKSRSQSKVAPISLQNIAKQPETHPGFTTPPPDDQYNLYQQQQQQQQHHHQQQTQSNNKQKKSAHSQYLHYLQSNELITQNYFYFRERKARKIYQDSGLHVLVLSLIFCLLLNPSRGTLDDLYCIQFPIMDGKQNVLYLLHYHLNHSANQFILPKLLRKVSKLRPHLAGERLLKLLCTSLFDMSIYSSGERRKIAKGAYGTVYECKTQLQEPKTVAIKVMQFPKTISERCVLHDIFTEIAVLQQLRLEDCVTELYDYGVDQQNYYIVMKKYACSLKDWRLEQREKTGEQYLDHVNLHLYLAIFKQILNTICMLHMHSVTHYDIKCENILLEFRNSSSKDGAGSNSMLLGQSTGTSATNVNSNRNSIHVMIGDFGESYMFSGEKDQFFTINRGTLNIKSPQMIQLDRNIKVESDFYDRRKKVGTNRLSDIWSLGCLFYELMTGDFLYEETEVYTVVMKQGAELISEQKNKKMNENWYLYDFLKFMLVRDPSRRPSIMTVLKRFEHVHALVSTGSAKNKPLLNINVENRGSDNQVSKSSKSQNRNISSSIIQGGGGIGRFNKLEQMLDEAVTIMHPSSCSEIIQQRVKSQYYKRVSFSEVMFNIQQGPLMTKIIKDIYLCSVDYLHKKLSKIFQIGVTHIIVPQQLLTNLEKIAMQERFQILYLDLPQSAQPVTSFYHAPAILDFLRKASICNGTVLFVEQNQFNKRNLIPFNNKSSLIRQALFCCLSWIFQTNSYQTWTLIKSQVIFIDLMDQSLILTSKYAQLQRYMRAYVNTYPKYECFCGSCQIIVKRFFANQKNIQQKICTCSNYYKSVVETSECPSGGCNDFLCFMKNIYGIEWSNLKWGFLQKEDFLIGPNGGGEIKNPAYRRILTGSNTIDFNSIPVRVVEKKPYDWNSSSRYQRWTLYMCSNCYVWTHAIRDNDENVAVLLNNYTKESASKGLLQPKNQKSEQFSNRVVEGDWSSTSQIQVPVLRNISLQSFKF